MAEIVVMPQQGNSVESVFLLGWKVAEGATCAVGDVLCEVETDKATMEVESTAAGTILALLAAEGDEVAVKAPLLVVGEPGEDYQALLGESGPAAVAQEAPPAASDSVGGRSPVQERGPAAAATPAAEAPPAAASTAAAVAGAAVSPRARLRAAEGGVDPATLSGTGPGGRVIERDVLAALVPGTAAAVGGGGARLGVAGSAIGGRVGVTDAPAGADSHGSGEPVAGEASYEEKPIKGVRRVIAEKMLTSLTTTAQLTLHRSADARALERLRARFKADGDAFGLTRVNINDMVMYAVARTLPRFPALNAHFLGDSIREYSRVDLGFAVDTERGLLVPTVACAEGRSLVGMSGEIRRLAELCQAGKAGPDELAPATFTVTNLGAFGIESFTPVLNPPQVAILGVSGITLRAQRGPDGSVEHIPAIGLSLTIDHQAVDGAPAARFLAAVAESIASFDMVLAL